MRNIKFFRGVDFFTIDLWVYWDKQIPTIFVEKKPNTEKLFFNFYVINNMTWDFIEEQIIEYEFDLLYHTDIPVYNYMKLRKFILKYLLKDWSLNINLDRGVDGGLTKECFNRVLSIYPNILDKVLDIVESKMFLSEEERIQVTKQSILLFSKNSKGVRNPHEAISNYCSLSSFWDKFGLNYYDLQKLPHHLYIQLKTVLNNESDMRMKEIQHDKNKNKSPKQAISDSILRKMGA